MKRLLSLLISIAVSLPAWASSSQNFTGTEILDSSNEIVATTEFSNFVDRAKSRDDFSKHQFEVTEIEANQYLISTDSYKMNIKFLGENFLTINGQLIKLDKNTTPDQLVNKIAKILSKRFHAANSYGLLNMIHDLLFPRAEAIFQLFGLPWFVPAAAAAMVIAGSEEVSRCQGFYAANGWGNYNASAQKDSLEYRNQKALCNSNNPEYAAYVATRNANKLVLVEGENRGSRYVRPTRRVVYLPAKTTTAPIVPVKTVNVRQSCVLFCKRIKQTETFVAPGVTPEASRR